MYKNIFLPIILFILLTNPIKSQKFPQFDKKMVLREGDFISKRGFYINKKDKRFPKKLSADFITMVVKENRSNGAGKMITIPVLRLHALTSNPKEPVFLFNGGPGGSNLQNFAMFLLNQHDIVMVGYRGVDGSVRLDSKALAKSLVADSNTFKPDHLSKIGLTWRTEVKRYAAQGIDIDGYNVAEMIDDIEIAKTKLGYNKINLFGYSFGSRIAYLYGMQYPESIYRSTIALVNTPGHFYHHAEEEDRILKMYSDIWKRDSANLKRSEDIVQTIQYVFVNLPAKWRRINLDPAKIRFMMYNYLQSVDGASQIFDAFISAKNNDYSGLACLVMMFDLMPVISSTAYGDLMAKGGSADYDSLKNYVEGTDSKENLLGAPFSKFFAVVSYSNCNVKLIPEKLRAQHTSYVQTLVINGNLDIATPLSTAQDLMHYLPNGKLIVLSDYSHYDVWVKQSDVYEKTVEDYFLLGEADEKNFKHMQANLQKPQMSLQKMGKTFYVLKRIGLLKTIARMVR